MRFILGMGLLICAHLAASTTFKTQIHRIESSPRLNEETLLFLSNGRIVKVLPRDLMSVDKLSLGKQLGQWFSIRVNERREVLSVKIVESPRPNNLDEQQKILNVRTMEDYIPTIIASMDEAEMYFRDHRASRDGETQCFNRAHIWAYDWRTKQNIYSKKIWIFFTAKYIRKHDFEWWFHVAPMVHVNVEGKIKERVMDMKYARGPNSTKQWSDIFMKDDALCPTVASYSDHADFPESGSCFIQKTSMYFYQPIDLELREKYGNTKTAWVASEIIQAYDEAFAITLK